MEYKTINITEKLSHISKHWTPGIIAQMNDYHFKLAKIRGEFVWHRHDETDEVFIIMHGSMAIELRDGKIDLKAGELFVVPKGMDHKPVAEHECSIMLVERAGTVNTGDAGGEMTAGNDVWL